MSLKNKINLLLNENAVDTIKNNKGKILGGLGAAGTLGLGAYHYLKTGDNSGVSGDIGHKLPIVNPGSGVPKPVVGGGLSDLQSKIQNMHSSPEQHYLTTPDADKIRATDLSNPSFNSGKFK